MPIYMKIEGIEGESVDQAHAGEIEVLSFSWGMSQGASSFSRGGAQKPSVSDFSFSAFTSKATPKLMLACLQGEHISQAVVSFATREGATGPVDYMKFKFEDLLVSSFHAGGAGADAMPTESFSLNFAKMRVDYQRQNADGTLGTPTTMGWDIGANKKL